MESEILTWDDMVKEIKIVKPGLNGSLIDENGQIVIPPDDWAFLPAGDASVTRKVTSNGPVWKVQVKIGRRIISKGIWASSEIIEQSKNEVEALRSTESYQKKLDQSHQRRSKIQTEYEKEFFHEVCSFLNFASIYKDLERKLAEAVTAHAIPVGSGTVARTSMIPVEERASRAVIAWMRHQATAYDSMKIPKIKGKRREIRRMLAGRSVELLQPYRDGTETSPDCPLKTSLKNSPLN